MKHSGTPANNTRVSLTSRPTPLISSILSRSIRRSPEHSPEPPVYLSPCVRCRRGVEYAAADLGFTDENPSPAFETDAMLMAALTVDFRKHSGPTPADDMAPQIITDCGNFTLDFKQCGFCASPLFLQTLGP
ncbi:hypothetical protein SKAU_G00252770 [Synaphobranchus kaupii]|uniref:Uncharacterized protein n=1 Tax=Synaphobranchus kaupii TaxID=118154 RepID=A0A9Q1F3K3_SYNKA|nr:hypothetical protein SKAU_G00252770 [Synaphobranchus kaupii]